MLWTPTILLSALALTFTNASVQSQTDYPPPDPADPVDYVEWINGQFGGQIARNAADTYAQAFARMEPFKGDWHRASDEEEQQWLDANREALDLFRRAVRIKDCFFKLDPSAGPADQPKPHPRAENMLLRINLPHLAKHRQAVRAIMTDCRHRAAKGDPRALADTAVLVIRASRHFDADAGLVGRLVGFAGTSTGYTGAREVLAAADPASARRLLDQLTRFDPPHASLDRALLVERLSQLDLHQRLFRRLSDGKTYRMVPQVAEGFEVSVGLDNRLVQSTILAIGYERMVADTHAYFDHVQQWMDTPHHQAQVDADLKNEFMSTRSNNLLLSAMLPTYERARWMLARIESERRATHLLAALRALPEPPPSLGELKNLPPDLYIDPLSAEPFIYRRTAEGFMLYSVGLNSKDDDGQHDPMWGEDGEGDHVFWPAQQ